MGDGWPEGDEGTCEARLGTDSGKRSDRENATRENRLVATLARDTNTNEDE